MTTQTIKLKEPIQFGSETITELTIRKPKAKDMRGLKLKMDMSDMLELASKVCAQPPSVIDELGFEDTTALLEILGEYMGGGLPTGETR